MHVGKYVLQSMLYEELGHRCADICPLFPLLQANNFEAPNDPHINDSINFYIIIFLCDISTIRNAEICLLFFNELFLFPALDECIRRAILLASSIACQG